jgi:dihydroorotase
MTMYLTDETDKRELISGFKNNVFFCRKIISC